jgi:hypothetical protein
VRAFRPFQHLKRRSEGAVSEAGKRHTEFEKVKFRLKEEESERKEKFLRHSRGRQKRET